MGLRPAGEKSHYLSVFLVPVQITELFIKLRIEMLRPTGQTAATTESVPNQPRQKFVASNPYPILISGFVRNTL